MDKEIDIIAKFANNLNGDDGAIFENFCFSKDFFIEGVHFKRSWLSFEQIGTKAVLVNISDAIAMNAKPLFALLGLALPKTLARDEINELCKGIKNTCEKFGVKVIGGDTTSSDKIIISLTIIAKTKQKTLFRKGAKKGDILAYTGKLGESNKGLKALQNKANLNSKNKFITPILRQEFISKSAKYLRSAMDISDGLLNDMPKILNNFGLRFSKNFSKQTLTSAEEYEMLICIPKKHLSIVKSVAKKCRVKLNIIGKISNAKYKLPKFRTFKHF